MKRICGILKFWEFYEESRKWELEKEIYCIHILSIWSSVSKIMIFSFVLVKIDGLISWTLGVVLWGYWILITMLAIIALFSFILFANSIYSYFDGIISYQGTFGSLWLFIFFGGLASSTLTTVINSISMFDSKSISNTELNIFMYLFLPLFTYLIVFISSTLLFWKSIIPFCDYLLYGKRENEDELNEEFPEIIPDQENQISQERTVKTVEVNIPIFLKRISDTLFVKGNKADKKKFQKQLKEVEESKVTKYKNEFKIKDNEVEVNKIIKNW